MEKLDFILRPIDGNIQLIITVQAELSYHSKLSITIKSTNSLNLWNLSDFAERLNILVVINRVEPVDSNTSIFTIVQFVAVTMVVSK